MTLFYYSTSEEIFSTSTDVPTRDDAIMEAIAELDVEVGDHVYIGERLELHAESYAPDGEDICEVIAERIYDVCGEACEVWPDASKEQLDELTASVRATAKAWFDKHGLQPTFFAVNKIQEVLVTEELRQKALKE